MTKAYITLHLRQFTATYRNNEGLAGKYETDGWVGLSVAVDIVRTSGRAFPCPELMTHHH
jgi:hypothetical protein